MSKFCIDVDNVFVFDGKETKEGIRKEFKERNNHTIKREEVIYLKPIILTRERFMIDKDFNKPKGNFSVSIGNHFIEQKNIKDFWKNKNERELVL